jgi:hypothetical protein
MDENIIMLEDLLTLFDERETAYLAYTEAIVAKIQPTVLAALQELFGVTSDQIEWSDIRVSEEDVSLHIECKIQYLSTDVIPSVIVAITNHQQPDDIDSVRVVRIGLPLVGAFKPKDMILAYLYKIIADQDKVALDSAAPKQFDMSLLNKEQVAQVLVFQHQTNGVKH